MYIDWVVTLSVIIIVLTCVFLGYGVRYCLQKINQEPQVEPKNGASQ